MKKVLIVGLDGATFELIKSWANNGKLTTFRFLLENGAHGVLKSTIPFLTVPAWPSFYTGKNPGKHGVFDFLTVHNFDPRERRVRSAQDVKSKSLWKILSDNQKKCLVFNVPLTYPPEKINGILVGGMLSVPEKTYTYPENLSHKLSQKKYLVDIINLDFRKIKEKDYFEKVIAIEENRYKIWLDLYKSQSFDFSMIVFRSSDIAGHDFWHDQRKMLLVYHHLDGLLAKILKLIDNETTLMLMSDHGFTGYKRTFNILAWLKKEGYLIYKTAKKDEVAALGWRQIHEEKNEDRQSKKKLSFTKKFFLKIRLDRQKIMRSRFFDLFRKILPKFIKNKIRLNLPASSKTIDWSKTQAYAQLGAKSTWGININLQSREKTGTVLPEKYQILKKEIIRKLKNTKTKQGENVFKNVFAREELYHGEYLSEAPDIIVTLSDKKMLAVARFDDDLIGKTTSHTSSYHDEDGIFLAFGKNVARKEIQDLKILDIAPTVLNILGVKNNEDMDGKVINLR